MKLILASNLSFILKYGYGLTGIPKDQRKIGYIMTASKGDRNKAFFENVNKLTKEDAKENGYVFEEIDIEERTQDEIKLFFKDKNIVYMEGGNSFYLLNAIRKTGFAEILKELLEAGKTYMGPSSAAYIMCPTIEVADWDETGKSRFEVTDFTALNYVPFLIKAHYKDEKEKIVRQKMKTLQYPLRILRDGQGILVEDGKYTFIGDGEETILNS